MVKQATVKQSGFTLIEVMIALAVLTIGLTGLAAMQLSAMQFSHSAHYRSMASTIVLDFEERLWLDLADNDLACNSDWASKVAEVACEWKRADLSVEDCELESENDPVKYALRVPGLLMEIPEDHEDSDPTDSVIEIPVSVGWSEARFEDTADYDDKEVFEYTFRIQCT